MEGRAPGKVAPSGRERTGAGRLGAEGPGSLCKKCSSAGCVCIRSVGCRAAGPRRASFSSDRKDGGEQASYEHGWEGLVPVLQWK